MMRSSANAHPTGLPLWTLYCKKRWNGQCQNYHCQRLTAWENAWLYSLSQKSGLFGAGCDKKELE